MLPQCGEWRGGRTEYAPHGMSPKARGTPIPIPHIDVKLAASHADNHLFHPAIALERFCDTPTPLAAGYHQLAIGHKEDQSLRIRSRGRARALSMVSRVATVDKAPLLSS